MKLNHFTGQIKMLSIHTSRTSSSALSILPKPYLNSSIFLLDHNDNLWPTGTYKVDIYMNGTLTSTVNFNVQ